ncbi:hypothetical protein COCON_G00194230 [Conger conger]|uniref:Uncharacterized protein n=1 Tax=Conger conger TaxID=82655 RepID=A0A9Q1HQM3_CONCO|nr:hypothetical protein COCON_G00194230 [Conger conger]
MNAVRLMVQDPGQVQVITPHPEPHQCSQGSDPDRGAHPHAVTEPERGVSRSRFCCVQDVRLGLRRPTSRLPFPTVTPAVHLCTLSAAGTPTTASTPREIEVQETLVSENFQICKTVRHGFPYQPTALAFDPVQKILAIGSRSGGTVKLLGPVARLQQISCLMMSLPTCWVDDMGEPLALLSPALCVSVKCSLPTLGHAVNALQSPAGSLTGCQRDDVISCLR